MNKTKIIFLFLILTVLVCGCGNIKDDKVYPSMWYVTSKEGFKPAVPDYVQAKRMGTEMEEIEYLPWTETLVFSDFFLKDQKLYLVTNKAGIMVFSPEAQEGVFTEFYPFPGEISERTCGNLFSATDSSTGEHTILLNVYKNTIFSEAESKDNLPGIYRCNLELMDFTPVFSAADYGLSPEAQTVDVSSGSPLRFCFKTSSTQKVDFDYMKAEDYSQGKFTLIPISEGEFKSSLAMNPESDLPLKARDFLNKNAIKFSTLELITGNKRILFTGDGLPSEEFSLHYENDKFLLLSPEGKFILGIDNSGTYEIKSFKLPLFSDKAEYTFGLLVGNTLVCMWEERDFYKVARSGLMITRID